MYKDTIPSDCVLVATGITEWIEDLGLLYGTDFAAHYDVAELCATPLESPREMVATTVNIYLGLEMPSEPYDAETAVDLIRQLFLCIHGYGAYLDASPIDTSSQIQIRDVPEEWSETEIRSVFPKAMHKKIVSIGPGSVSLRSEDDVKELILRLHSSPDEWDWTVGREGHQYVHAKTGLKVQQIDDPACKIYIHSIPEDWTEKEVRSLIPDFILSSVTTVPPMQFRQTKSGKSLGRTHIIFDNPHSALQMMHVMGANSAQWRWRSIPPEGYMLYRHAKSGVVIEPTQQITWNHLMGGF
jgi:hypothetical protein